MSFLEEEGFISSPGYETSISLKQAVFRRLPPSFKDKCFSYEIETILKCENSCIRACLQNENLATCGCIVPTLLADSDRNANMTLHSKNSERKNSAHEPCSLVILTPRFEATRGLFWDGRRNFEPLSDGKDDA
ncbi:hypothetical protein AVEN_117966-1 [Araneus ventricosus]|uniref:Uncharacterized protein n=1 Tax=Araneus ventricosus TaxID=182803 RepID=A0A4Y2H2Z7_ARAVE|nr:hypothetical protein AVEN_117966-1 [Araneus ventricosus]